MTNLLKSVKPNDNVACANFLLNKGISPDERYFDVSKIVSDEFNTYIIISKKGIGKTYSMLRMGLENFTKTGERFAFLRRSKTERDGFVKGVLKPVLPSYGMGYSNGTIYKFPSGTNNIRNQDNQIVGHVLSLSTANSSASTIDGGVSLIFFDEFVSKGLYYIPHEIEIFLELIKTLERDVKGVKIILSSNANDHNNPYINYWDIPSKWWFYSNKKESEKVLYLRIPRSFFIPTDSPKFTSQSWVKRNERMDDFLNKAEFLKTDEIVKTQRELTPYEKSVVYYIQLNKTLYALYEIMNANSTRYLVEQVDFLPPDATLYNFTSIDNFNASGFFPSDPTSFFSSWWQWLNNRQVWFASYEARDEIFKYLPRIFYQYPKVTKWQ